MAKFIDGLYYSESHEYVKVDGEFAYLGITDYAQSQLGSVVYVDMPSEGDEISAGENFGAVESVKAASDLTSPVSGDGFGRIGRLAFREMFGAEGYEVVAINEQLEDNPELLNEDAFENWIVKVKLTNPQELNDLMSVSDYKEICK